MAQRFVVEVTERVEPSELPGVAQQVAEQLKTPPERWAALLADHIGPVTHPLERAPAEQVAQVLRAAGVRVSLGEVSVVRSAAQLPSTRWLPSPHEIYERDLQLEQSMEHTDPELGGTDSEGGSGSGRGPAAARGEAAAVLPAFPGVREGWTRDARGRTPEDGSGEIDFEPDRSRLRRPLLLALVLALIVLIVLQIGFALRGAPAGGYELGLARYRQGQFAAARRLWLPVAAGGDARAQFMVGYLSEMGLGQPWSNAGAAPWYRQAAERGHAQAQARLASLYARGMGVAYDEATASRWYLAAAREGLLEAQHEMGLRLLHGRGVEADAQAARAWFELAAAAGHAEAANLAALLRSVGESESLR